MRFGLDVADRSELFDKSTERMEGGDGPPLDAGDEEFVGVAVGKFDEVGGSLFGRDGTAGTGNEKTLVSNERRPVKLISTHIRGTRLSVGLNQMILGLSILFLSSPPRRSTPSFSLRSASCFSLVAAELGLRSPKVPLNN